MARSTLPAKDANKPRGIYIPLWHVLIFLGLVLAIPLTVEALNRWKNAEEAKTKQGIEAIVKEAIGSYIPTTIGTGKDFSKEIQTLAEKVDNFKHDEVELLKAEINVVRGELEEFNSRLLLLANELEKLNDTRIPVAEPVNSPETY